MPGMSMAVALATACALALAAAAGRPQLPPLHIIPPPPVPPHAASMTASNFRLATVLHNGVVHPETGDTLLRVAHAPADMEASWTLRHRRGVVPAWSAVSPRVREAAWRDGLEKGESVDALTQRLGGVVRVLHKDTAVPDVKDPETILKFTYNSYFEPPAKEWIPVPGYNVTDKFGWDSDGIRGYVFLDEANEVVVLAIKGTSLQTPVSGGPTAPRDKFNDNMFFSCCCGKAGWSWTPVCECAKSSNECDMGCIHERSQFANSYYNLANTIYWAVANSYPKSYSIWMTGHSLGGALASLLALTHDLPGVSFQAPGELQFADRIGLIPRLPPRQDGGQFGRDDFLKTLEIVHVGNDKDPIFLGECQGVGSSCYYVGYALETNCHAGRECVYRSTAPALAAQADSDEVEALGTDVRYHSIETVIKTYLESLRDVPECVVRENCTECGQWTWV